MTDSPQFISFTDAMNHQLLAVHSSYRFTPKSALTTLQMCLSQLCIELQSHVALNTKQKVTCYSSSQCPLSCSLCFHRLVAPIVLNCGHLLCRECVQSSASDLCPFCHRSTMPSAKKACVNLFLKGLLNSKKETDKSKFFDTINMMDVNQMQKMTEEQQQQPNLVLSLQQFADLKSSDPLNPTHYYGCALCLDKMEDPVQAVNNYFQAIQLNPYLEDAFIMQVLQKTMKFMDVSDNRDNSVSFYQLSMEVNQNNQFHVICERVAPPAAAESSEDTTSSPSALTCKCLSNLTIVQEDAECILCYQVLYQPCCTPCGHTFCLDCVHRALDYDMCCPLCKFQLVEFFSHQPLSVCKQMEQLIAQLWPDQYEERHKEKMQDLAPFRLNADGDVNCVPIMVCTLAWPGVPCPLNIFEPRYQIMVRLVMEAGSAMFGMTFHFNNDFDIITVLKIDSLSYTMDGRCILDTVGYRRYSVLSCFIRDGFVVANVTPYNDLPLEGTELNAVPLLCMRIHQLACSWFGEEARPLLDSLLPPHLHQQLQPSGPTAHWWIISSLPIPETIKYAILRNQSLFHRLYSLTRCLTHLMSLS